MTPQSPQSGKRVKAFLLADRIDTSNLEQQGVVSTAPLTYRVGDQGFVTLFRYGVAVTLCLSPSEEDEVLRSLRSRLIRPVATPETETLLVEIVPDKEDQILPGGPMLLKTLTPDQLIVIADALSKSVVLARDEREVAAVFDLVEPFARQLAEKGRADAGRQDLERLYARLQDEYELKERAEALSRKLSVIAETAEVLTDIIDTKRSLRLEIAIVVLFAVELVIAAYQALH